jgi:enoyl-CoA hydratase/carnithine racemase
MDFKEIIFKVEKGIAVIKLNRPDIRNAISGFKIIREIEKACSTVNQDMAIKVMILTATDPAFSSGGNIKDMAEKKGMFKGSPSEVMESYRRNIQRIPMAVHRVEIPTIAAVNGPAIGAGCDLALMCDMRVASEKARFGETFINIGLIPGDGGAYFLPKIVGMPKACELTFTGDIVDASQALSMGLINEIVSHEKLMETTKKLAEKIASKPSMALRMSKRLLYMGQKHGLKELLEQSASYQALCHFSDEHQQALSALLKK